MVMDRPLSPQSVGREFVRQYYTLLNEAPAHLHRFYNNSSSFVHGGLGAANREIPVVVGQKQIHQQIQQLNFRDCHAKISQVDSQATLDNGVVVQVSGELSNAGQPMRRFTQTFVLAAQSPKKYYVHNDIFRYQDLLSDEELENEMSRSEAEEDQESEVQQNDTHPHEVEGGYYGGMAQVVNGISESKSLEEVSVPVPEQPPSPYNSMDMIQQQPPPAQHTEPMIPVVEAVVAGGQSYGSHMVEMQQPEPAQDYHISSQPAKAIPQISSTEPKTYANLVKQGHNVGGTVYYNSSPPVVAAPQLEPTSPPPQLKSEGKGFESRGLQSNGPRPQRNDVQQRNSYNSFPRHQNNEDTNGDRFSDSNNFGGDDRRRSTYTDHHQVFVGNIPHNAAESDLKDLFGQFGAIVDFKILSKPSKPGPIKLPYYGFIIFEDVGSVQAVLNAKPIMFPDENGVKLNVEEKKARRGGEGGGRGGRGNGGMMGGRGGAPGRGGPRGGGIQRFNQQAPLPHQARR